MATNKMTNVIALNAVIDFATANEGVFSAEVVEKITKIRDTYTKKSENRKPTKAQVEGAEIREAIKDVVVNADKALTATQVLNAVAGKFEGITLPKVTAQLTKLKETGEVVRFMDKKTAYFKAVEADEVED